MLIFVFGVKKSILMDCLAFETKMMLVFLQ